MWQICAEQCFCVFDKGQCAGHGSWIRCDVEIVCFSGVLLIIDRILELSAELNAFKDC